MIHLSWGDVTHPCPASVHPGHPCGISGITGACSALCSLHRSAALPAPTTCGRRACATSLQGQHQAELLMLSGRASRHPQKGGGGPMPTCHPSNWPASVHCPHCTPSIPFPAAPSLPRAQSLFELGCSSPDFVIYTISKLCSHFHLLHHSGHKNYSTN